jgi:hypothetical protein
MRLEEIGQVKNPMTSSGIPPEKRNAGSLPREFNRIS